MQIEKFDIPEAGNCGVMQLQPYLQAREGHDHPEWICNVDENCHCCNERQKKINIPGQEFGNVFHETHQESDLQFCNESACHCFDLDRMLKQTA